MNLQMENAKILGGSFRNFRGEAGKFNNAGNRNFCVALEPELAAQLSSEGWNVRSLVDKDTGEILTYYTQIVVNYNFNNPPKIYRVTSAGPMLMDESTVGQLDYDVINSADMIIYPHPTTADDGTTRYKGYLKTLYANIEEDSFASKYGV